MIPLYIVGSFIVVGAMLIVFGKVFKGWRTRVFNGVSAVLAILEVADLSFLPNGQGPAIALGITFVNLMLREDTTTPAGQG